MVVTRVRLKNLLEAARGQTKETIVGIKVVYNTFKQSPRVKSEFWGFLVMKNRFLVFGFTTKLTQRADLDVFCLLGAARGQTKETIVGIKVAYNTYKHSRSVKCDFWGFWGDL